ncbi:UDP-glucuronosyl/UDP-glucosyltransferase [Corchorus capsularis]|uniref:UDP-glucuronosyl/UDP-glucosyltransferase n=1 Tax=Corchorus capsularis TaxID=210143 RepID=A0A1R3G4E4_COCAP|nr:UDP-glucuronosyl/UDP-glucosyltransferase [Corchorus capsularis]
MPSNGNRGHILMIPFPASGHLLPHMDLTHQLLLGGLTVTIMVTPKNLHYLNPLLSLHSSSNNLQTLVLPFPSHSSIPIGVENLQQLFISFAPDFVAALSKLHDPLFQWFQTHPSPPVAIISDMLLCSWTNRLASQLNIPNISFIVINAKAVASWWVNLQLLPECAIESPLTCMRSWGVIFNSFAELDSKSLKVLGEAFIKHDRIWSVGPLLPIKAISNGPNERGGQSSIPQDQVVAWLDSCPVENSVVYVGFGTQITLTKQQMKAVASALEESGVRFIWVVKDPMKGTLHHEADDQSVVPMGFEDRVAGRGLVINGWAPQLAILGHRAVGSYLTHCGWNSTLEAILAGVLLLAWPMQVDHFENTRLLVDELGVAIRVCEGLETVPDAMKLAWIFSESVGMARPERDRAKKLRESAFDAIKEGGSSFEALERLVEQLSSLSNKINKEHQ